MRKNLITSSLLIVSAAAIVGGCAKDSKPAAAAAAEKQPVVSASGGYVSIGDPMKLSSAPVPVAAVLASPTSYTGKPIRIAGTVEGVCETKGCWINLSDPASNQKLFVKFTCSDEGGRIVPMEAKGRPAIVEGTVVVKEISEADARHYAEDGGASKEEIAKIVGPQKQITVSSPSVQIAMR
jgi:hypothetical protein